MKSVLRCKKIITCKHDEVLEKSVVAIENDRIVFVGREAALANPSHYDEIRPISTILHTIIYAP